MLNLSGIREENMDSTYFEDTESAGIEITIDDIPLQAEVRSPPGKNLSRSLAVMVFSWVHQSLATVRNCRGFRA